MVPENGDAYIHNAEGWYVGWSVKTGSEFIDWSWLDVCIEVKSGIKVMKITPVRKLTPIEVITIRHRSLLFWSMKVPMYEWALVMCRASEYQSVFSEIAGRDDNLSIGV